MSYWKEDEEARQLLISRVEETGIERIEMPDLESITLVLRDGTRFNIQSTIYNTLYISQEP